MNLRYVIAIVIFGLPVAIFVVRAWLYIRQRNKKSRLPVTDIPRPAGWSLQKRIDELGDDLSLYLLVLLLSCGVGGVIYAIGLHLFAALIGTMPFAIWALIKLMKVFPSYSKHTLGLLGEQAVGAVLNSISNDRIRVFHDFPVKEQGKKPWNIDHVVVSPDGVFVIETKARRKSLKRGEDGQKGHVVKYDGKKLKLPHSIEEQNLKQACRNAEWMSKHLSSAVGDPVTCRPVLVMVGWMVDYLGKGEVDVLNEKLLTNHFSGRKNKLLSSKMVQRINHQLEQKCKIDLA